MESKKLEALSAQLASVGLVQERKEEGEREKAQRTLQSLENKLAVAEQYKAAMKLGLKEKTRLAEEKKCEEGALAVQGYELSEQELPEQQEQDLVDIIKDDTWKEERRDDGLLHTRPNNDTTNESA